MDSSQKISRDILMPQSHEKEPRAAEPARSFARRSPRETLADARCSPLSLFLGSSAPRRGGGCEGVRLLECGRVQGAL